MRCAALAGKFNGDLQDPARGKRPDSCGFTPWRCLAYCASAGSAARATDVLRKGRGALRCPTRRRGCCQNAQAAAQQFLAAFSSRPIWRPHTPHRWVRFDSALGTVVPQREQRCDVPAGGTSTRAMPARSAVPLRMSRNSRQFRSPIAGFRPRFPRPPRSRFLIFTASAAMKLQILTIRSARRWGSCRLRHPPPLHSPRLAHHTEAPEAIHRRQRPPDREPHPRHAVHPQFAPLAPVENPDRAPRRLRIVDADRAVPALRPAAWNPGLRPGLHPREERLHRPVPTGKRRACHQDRDVPPLRVLPPNRGQRLVLVVERNALPRHAPGQNAHFEGRVVEQREHGKDPVPQAVPRSGKLHGVPEGLCSHGKLLRMRRAGARRREGTTAFGGNGPASILGENDIGPYRIGRSDACARPASTPFSNPVAAASAFEGRDVGGPWRGPDDLGLGPHSVQESRPPIRAGDASQTASGGPLPRQPSVRKRGGQVPPERVAVRRHGIYRVGPSW